MLPEQIGCVGMGPRSANGARLSYCPRGLLNSCPADT